jgi:hypothetical protein
MRLVEQLIFIVNEAIARASSLEQAEDSPQARRSYVAAGIDLHQALAKLKVVAWSRPVMEDTSKWDLDKWLDFLGKPQPLFKLELQESDRQMLLMAMAHLAVERPGLDYPLDALARQIDEVTDAGPTLYTKFKSLHAPTHCIAGVLDLVGSVLLQPPVKDEQTLLPT